MSASSDIPASLLGEGFFSSLLIDTCWFFFGIFQPRYKKNARYVIKAAYRCLHYKKDILPADKIKELNKRIDDVKEGMALKDKELTEEKTSLLIQYLDILPGTNRNALSENVESFFVIFALFIGFNAYIAQPFRIPTGSMQPSLNGIRALSLSEGETPSFPSRIWNAITQGSTYEHIVADQRKSIVDFQGTTFLVFTRTVVYFDDGSTIRLPGSTAEIARYFTTTKGTDKPTFRAGETIVNARFDAGDLVLVNKVSYHFRKPERGEVFVFDTRNIFDLGKYQATIGPHYIKRLVGVPGDTLQIKPPALIVNGHPAQESTIRRVINGQPPYNKEGYQLTEHPAARFNSPDSIMQLAIRPDFPQMNEYAAMGDNTSNSLDTRYWGSVKQYNIIGPALFNFWPFTWHWGYIP